MKETNDQLEAKADELARKFVKHLEDHYRGIDSERATIPAAMKRELEVDLADMYYEDLSLGMHFHKYVKGLEPKSLFPGLKNKINLYLKSFGYEVIK
jgi:hypothetical protein